VNEDATLHPEKSHRVNYPALKGAASCFIEPAPEGLT